MANSVSGMFNANKYSYLFDNKATANVGASTEVKQSAATTVDSYNVGAVAEVKQNADAVVKSYNEAKDTFYAEFDSNISALKKSAANIKNVNFNVGENAITKTAETDKDGNEVKDKNGNTVMKTTYSKEMQSALDAVKELVDNYNEMLGFLQDNSEVSGRVSRMASNFGDTTYRASLYEEIGINVGKDGTLSIDEEKLANSIVNNGNKVARIVGSEGLAGKAEQHVNEASAQRNNLFPSAKTMIGKQMDQVELYTGKSMINMLNISNIGNLINMMF